MFFFQPLFLEQGNLNCNYHTREPDFISMLQLFSGPYKQQSLFKTICQLLLKSVQSTTFTNMVSDGLEQFSSSLLFHMFQGRRDFCVLIPWPMAGFQHLAQHSRRESEWCSYSPWICGKQRCIRGCVKYIFLKVHFNVNCDFSGEPNWTVPFSTHISAHSWFISNLTMHLICIVVNNNM